jgi:protein subunit release factor A
MDQQENNLRQEYAELSPRFDSPDIFSSSEYPKLARRKSQLEELLNLFDEKKSLSKNLEDSRALLTNSDEELASLAQIDIAELNGIAGT